ncbi:MAG: FAD-dependent oxidoreductase [Paracoccaceae bacterium]
MTVTGPETWCVAGGGMLGQALALRLQAEGKRVTLIEAAPDLGGLASAWEVGGVRWDRFYHVILPFDRNTLSLLDDIGLGTDVVWAKSRTGFYARGRMSPLNGALDYLRLPVLGPVAKARLAWTLMRAARIADGGPLSRRPVGEWLTERSGRAAYERLWKPLLRAKLGDNAERASAAFIWATIRRLYLARGSGAKTETLGFVEGGYARVLEALAGRLRLKGVEIVCDCPIRRVVPVGGGFRVETAKGPMAFDRVVSTLPSGPTAALCETLSADIRSRLAGVLYQGIICASVVLNRPLGGNYLTYLTDPDLPFTAVVEMSALTETARTGGHTLAYLPRYVTQDDAFWALSDDEIRARFVAGLRRIFPDLAEADIRAVRIARVRHVMAVPTVGYAEVVPPVRTNVAGFHIVNSSQITDGTLNVDATLGVIDRALPELLGTPPAAIVRSAA